MSSQPHIDAIALLKADHRKVEGLFEAFETTRGAAKKLALAQEICAELMIHTTIEEEIFYPACAGKVEEELLNEAFVEHDSAKWLIAEILRGKPGDEFYDAQVTVLAEEIKHHVHEEEMRSEGLFAQARAAGLDMDRLAERMKARKEILVAQFATTGLAAPQSRTLKPAAHEVVGQLDIKGDAYKKSVIAVAG